MNSSSEYLQYYTYLSCTHTTMIAIRRDKSGSSLLGGTVDIKDKKHDIKKRPYKVASKKTCAAVSSSAETYSTQTCFAKRA